MALDIRTMRDSDVEEADTLWRAAFAGLGEGPPPERSDKERALDLSRFRHLLGTDPLGSAVAEVDGRVAGFCQAHRREKTFVLGMLGVHPDFQDRGIGKRLLERALSYGEGSTAQYIFSSMDPRALHRYVRAGFSLHPTVFATKRAGAPEGDELTAAPGSAGELAVVADIDRAVRGSARSEDVGFWLRAGQRLVLDEEGGYAVVSANRLTTLAARTEEVARRLLERVLRSPGEIGLSWIAAEQQWAVETAATAGCTLVVRGAVMSRGVEALPAPYLPNGLFG
ncbi:MAG TPA: GNAT family N-acetyltransferase [Acidimicrobiales bacterium]|nr:GNAT family N-acetyltransferase [Acidimicrobiales bacterium]